MPRISFNEAIASEGTNRNDNSVQFFSLKNDGDSAIVRIMYDSVNDFEIYPTHGITVNGKFRKVACLRGPHDDIDKCPLCASNAAIGNTFYIRMLKYTNDETGKLNIEPVIWERSVSYAKRLVAFINDYGKLSDYIFKITRRGAAGSQSTTYDINLANPSVYTNAAFPKDNNVFSNYKVLGEALMDKDASEMNTFIATGSFPMKQQENNNTQVPAVNQQANYSTTNNPVPNYVNTYSQAPQANNWQISAPENVDYFEGPNEVPQAPARPKRFY